MKIAQVSGLGCVWGAYPPDVLDREDAGTVGGGEAAMLRTSFGLAARGHQVTVFYPGEAGAHCGVSFRSEREALVACSQEGFDAVVSWSDPQVLEVCPQATRRLFSQQLNNLPGHEGFLKSVECVVAASEDHADYLCRYWPAGRPEPKWAALYCGFQLELYRDQKPLAERAPVVSYWSSPDRGLHHLLAIWPEVLRAVPDAELRIAYRLHPFLASARDPRAWRAGSEVAWRGSMVDSLLKRRMSGVKLLGPLPRQQLAKHQLETKVWAFPFDPIFYTEGLCCSMGESIAAGCYSVARPCDALPSVYGDAIRWVPGEICDSAWRYRFSDAVIEGLRATEVPEHQLAARQHVLSTYTWERATANLEEAILSCPR